MSESDYLDFTPGVKSSKRHSKRTKKVKQITR